MAALPANYDKSTVKRVWSPWKGVKRFHHELSVSQTVFSTNNKSSLDASPDYSEESNRSREVTACMLINWILWTTKDRHRQWRSVCHRFSPSRFLICEFFSACWWLWRWISRNLNASSFLGCWIIERKSLSMRDWKAQTAAFDDEIKATKSFCVQSWNIDRNI